MLDKISILSGTSNPILSNSISKSLNKDLSKISIIDFPDSEISVQIGENIRNKDVYIIQSLALNPNRYIMELALMVDAVRRSSAKSITAVIPYMAYARQDRKDKPRVSLGGKTVANILSSCQFDHLITVNLHSPQVEGFFDMPCDHLSAVKPLVDALKSENTISDLVVVAPDIGSVKIAQKYAALLNAEFAIIYKIRNSPLESKALALLGDVSGRTVLLADDLCSTGTTLVKSAELCREKGATRIIAAVSHGQFVNRAIEDIEASEIDLLYYTNSIQSDYYQSNFRVVDVGPTIANAIATIQAGGSVSSLCY